MINPDIQQHLRNKYNPDGSPLRCHQLKMLDILKYIDYICRKNGISYWLSSGTCLGAVRHGGFIPWDDDVDIEMMRDDYTRFLKVFEETDQFILQTHRNDRFYPGPFSKVRMKNTIIYDSLYKYRGVFVDVFCMEYSHSFIARIMELYQKSFSVVLYNLLKAKQSNRIFFHLMATSFSFLKKSFYLIVPFVRFISAPFPGKVLRHTYGVGWVNNIRFETDIFPIKYVHFEDTSFPVPGDYDKYLTRIYGDYMNIPSEDKIALPHVQYYNQ